MESINKLIMNLGNINRRIRQRAERELVKRGKPAVKLLVVALDHENWVVRWRAADTLGKIGDTRAIEPLIQRFTDCQRVQICASCALGKIGKPALDPLVHALEDENWEVRDGAVMAVGLIGDPTVVGTLEDLLRNDCHNSVRWRAAIALGHIGVPRSVGPLVQALKDDNLLVRGFASSSLGDIGEAAIKPLSICLGDSNWEIRQLAVRALGRIESTEVVDLLIRAFGDKSMEVHASAAFYLGEKGDARAVQPLVKALKDDNMRIRLHAAEALGKFEGLTTIKLLKEALQDDRYAVREAAAISITKQRDPVIGPILRKMKLRVGLIHNGLIRTRERKRFSAFIEPLSQALRKGDGATRMAAVLALSVIGGPRPIPLLIQALNNDKDKDVRMAAVGSLGIIGRTRAKEVLKHALNDDSPEVRSKALGALSFLRDTSAVEPLLRALRDEDKDVRLIAAGDLGVLGGGSRVAERMIRMALENVDDSIRKEATYALAKMEKEKEHEALYSEIWKA